MKTPRPVLGSILLVLAGGCASTSDQALSGSQLSSTGPTVLTAHTEPGTIELNRDLQPLKPAEIIADVKDFKASVTDVKLQFIHVPLEIAMSNVGGTTWRAELSTRQLQMLAVSGRTMKYEANVIAKNEEGRTAISREPVQVAIKAPDLSQQAGQAAPGHQKKQKPEG
jgi:hypothetical protein